MSIQNNIPKYIPIIESYPDGFSCSNFMKDFIMQDDEFGYAFSCYIETIYGSGFFLIAMYHILVEKDAYCPEWVACYYPEWNCPDPDLHFEGVRFEIGGISDIECRADVPEEVAFFYLKKACERFMELHPEKEYTDYLQPMLDNWKPSS